MSMLAAHKLLTWPQQARRMEFDRMASLNFKNRTLFHGGSLEFLRAMNSHSVHLIATNPLFWPQQNNLGETPR